MFDAVLRKLKDVLIRPLTNCFSCFSPLTLTLISLFFGIMCNLSLIKQQSVWLSLALWLFNRLFDALDGAVARMTNRSSDFGGHLDLLVDFVVYCTIPISISIASSSCDVWFSLSLLLSSYCLNTVSLFHLSSILEKHGRGVSLTGEITTITMPASLVEGGETILFYSLFILFPTSVITLFQIFAFLVIVTVLFRSWWGYGNI
eukprot:TRINITY_DN9532_c0_g1_i2.p1 TRINITY_DN9532_c0_g1~~TRINITY_DN9532_c0_g1_i2.p1  ORF type:complete len:203 (+),score=12.87 TRINITY_DN9532_c0_g1_i2:55-663(+)